MAAQQTTTQQAADQQTDSKQGAARQTLDQQAATQKEAPAVDAVKDGKLDLSVFDDPQIAKRLINTINEFAPDHANLMEVCGTHTVAIARNGIRALMPSGCKLLSGPGCPVCVTANQDIDAFIALSKIPNVIITTFGDMKRVPGSTSSLIKEQSQGADVCACYSPLDALTVAKENPDKQVVFIGVGFETTTPLVAMAIKHAKADGLKNFSVACAHKNMPNALRVLVNDPSLEINALILPGHVCTITGTKPFEFLAKEFGIPGVVTGFEPVDVLQGIAMLMRQLHEGRAEVEIAYKRGVKPEGNVTALAVIDDVFETCTANWRGLGDIPGSGYRIRREYEDFDAMKRFQPTIEPTVEPKGCRCGDVLRGALPPDKCPLFDKVCTPEHPVGPCMVSTEGSCAAYWRYYR